MSKADALTNSISNKQFFLYYVVCQLRNLIFIFISLHSSYSNSIFIKFLLNITLFSNHIFFPLIYI